MSIVIMVLQSVHAALSQQLINIPLDNGGILLPRSFGSLLAPFIGQLWRRYCARPTLFSTAVLILQISP
jgi:hypothetical protein